MASLTDTLASINSGKAIINPGPASPSVVGALADAATAAIPGVVEIGRERDRRTERQKQEERERALDEFEGEAFRIRTGQTAQQTVAVEPEFTQTGPAPFAPELEGSGLPSDVISVTDEAVRAQRAAQQGRVPAARADLQLEALVDGLMRKYPEQRAEIAQYAQSRGLDHYMFRAFKADQDMLTVEAEARRQALSYQFTVAGQSGIDTSTMSLEQGAELGRQIINERNEQAAITARLTAARENRRLDIEEQKILGEQAADELVSSITSETAIAMTPLLEQTVVAIAAAGTDPERQRIVGERKTAILGGLVIAENRAIAAVAAAGGSQAQVEAVRTQYKGYRDSVDMLFTESFEQNKVALDNFAAATGLQTVQALPIYTGMVRLLGQSATNALLADPTTGLLNMDPTIIEAVKNELKSFDPTTPAGTMSLARAIGYMRGDIKLRDLTGTEAQTYINMNAAAHQGNQAAVLAGNTAAITPWMETYGNIIEAASELPMRGTRIESIGRSAGLYATPAARRALDEAIKANPEFGLALAQGSRAAAAHGLQVWKSIPMDGPYSIVYNRTAGKYEVGLTQQAYTEWARGQRNRFGATFISGGQSSSAGQTVPSFEQMRTNVPQELRDRANYGNALLDHLTQTDKYDEAIPNNLTLRERRGLYAEGRTPDSMRVQQEGESMTAESEFDKMIGNLDQSVQGLIVGTTSRPLGQVAAPPRDQLQRSVRQQGEALGLDWNFVDRLVRKESGWNVNAENETTRASGLFQINDNTPRTLERNISDGLNLAVEAKEGAQQVLGREPKDWEIYVMYQQGAGGGAALLNPANANRNAVDVLEEVYGNRRLARQAVTANMGNVNMTAGQFARTIGNYFERD